MCLSLIEIGSTRVTTAVENLQIVMDFIKSHGSVREKSPSKDCLLLLC